MNQPSSVADEVAAVRARNEALVGGSAVWRAATQLQRREILGRAYAVSTVGFQEEQVRKYVRDQEQLDGHNDTDEDGQF